MYQAKTLSLLYILRPPTPKKNYQLLVVLFPYLTKFCHNGRTMVVMAHISNPSTWKEVARGLGIQGHT